MIASIFDSNSTEFQHGKYIVDTAVSQGVKLFIWRTRPSPREISGGKYTRIIPDDDKANVEKYLKRLDMTSVFCSTGSPMDHFNEGFFSPSKDKNQFWCLNGNCSGDTKIPLLDATGDSGKWVFAILSNPDR
jgi:hypothetical protein